VDIVTLDFETFFDDGYTLSKMTTEHYVRDPRFKAHGAGIRWPDGRVEWFDDGAHCTLRNKLRGIDWDKTACLAHHAHFDGLILNHHYGIRPAFWFDTLSMARALIGNHLSAGLGSLAEQFGLGAKDVPYDVFRGKHWSELTDHEQRWVGEGCCHDVQLTWDIFLRLASAFPDEEYELVDATVRMFTEPKLVGDTDLLAEIWQEEQAAKAALLAELGITGEALRKNEVFANLLRARGVEPGVKAGKPDKDGGEREIYAFAKTDVFMRDLLEGDDDSLVLLAEARLSEKSNLVATRSARLGWMSTRGSMCVYLGYAAAHTKRWGGGDKTNYQNFPRPKEIPEGLKPTEQMKTSAKRAAKMQRTQRAPPGHLLVIRDASQIECRLLNMCAGQWDKVEDFRLGRDPYVGVASAFFGYEVNKKDHPDQRQVGKVLELQCGYQSGGAKIKHTLRTQAGVHLTDEEGVRARDAYRATHPAVQSYWDTAGYDVLPKMHAGQEFSWGIFHIREKRLYAPNGLSIDYTTLEWHVAENGDKFWRIKTRDGCTKLYGGKFTENVIQFAARVHVSQAWLRCRRAGLDMVSMEHDKLIACVREGEAEAAFAYMGQEMSRAPEWMPELPLDSEGYISDTFAKPEKP